MFLGGPLAAVRVEPLTTDHPSGTFRALHVTRVSALYGLVSAALLSGCGGSSPATSAPAQAPDTPGGTAREKSPTEALEPARVVQAIRNNEKRLRMCFFRAPDASGFVRLAWHVDSEGAVRNVSVENSTIEDKNVQKCLASRVEELRFGELGRSAKAEWTYVFRLAEPLSEKERKRAAKKRSSVETESGVSIDEDSDGTIDLDAVESVVQAGYGLFARCYRDAVGRDEALRGWIALRFEIDESGRVSSMRDGNSDLTDRMAIDCVAESLFALQFPKPENGSVKLLYRIRLN